MDITSKVHLRGIALQRVMVGIIFAAWNFAYGIVNQHLDYGLICATVYGLGAGRYDGLDGLLASRFPSGFRNALMSGEPVAVPA